VTARGFALPPQDLDQAMWQQIIGRTAQSSTPWASASSVGDPAAQAVWSKWIPAGGADGTCGFPFSNGGDSEFDESSMERSGWYRAATDGADFYVEADELHMIRPCRINLGSSPTWGALNAWLPDTYTRMSSEREFARDWLPDWCAEVLESTMFPPSKARANITSDAPPAPGLFFRGDEGYYVQAVARGLSTLYAYCDLSLPPEVFRQAAGNFLDPGNLRKQLRQGNWKTHLVLAGERGACQSDFGPRILEWALSAIDCCESKWVFLRLAADGSVGGCITPAGLPMKADGGAISMNCGSVSPGAFTPFRTVRVCDGKRRAAIFADYLFWWAARLHAVLQDVDLRMGRDEAAYLQVGPHFINGVDQYAAWKTRMENTGQACARLGLAYLVDLATMFAHEFGHASRNLLGRRKWHCNYDTLMYGSWVAGAVLGSKVGDLLGAAAGVGAAVWLRDKTSIANECYQYMYEETFRNRALAELGLPEPDFMNSADPGDYVDPFTLPEHQRWFRYQVDVCDITADEEPEEVYAVKARHCGLLTRKRQVEVEYWWPIGCSGNDTLKDYPDVQVYPAPDPAATGNYRAWIGPRLARSYYTSTTFNRGNTLCEEAVIEQYDDCKEGCEGLEPWPTLHDECMTGCDTLAHASGMTADELSLRGAVDAFEDCIEACHIVGMLAGSEAEELCHLACLEMALDLLGEVE
jgi:hypothetical protein